MKRSKHSLSHYKLLTCKMGQLVPVSWFEALPGDTVQMATSALIRCAPLVTPVMHPITVRFHHWFVPNRLIWANWQNFITGGSDGLDATAHPYITFTNPAVSSLADYLGVPTANFTSKRVSALPFRAYNLIFNEYYRDEDLVTALVNSTGDGSDTTSNTTLQTIAWEKDYLTSARPWAIKGSAITLPVGGTAPVVLSGTNTFGLIRKASTGALDGQAGTLNETAGSHFVQNTGTTDVFYDPNGTLAANLAGATGVDINTVRNAFALQRFEEARARYGSRYTEYLRYLGIRSSDARLQRPEYLGGGRNVIQFSEVLQTGVTTSGTPSGVGTMFGHGITGMRTNRYRRFFEEHGIVITLMSVRPKTMYSQRLKRGFMRGVDTTYVGTTGNKYDYWQRELQTIGQQQVNATEVDPQAGVGAFGYQDRYDEYRREESSVAGLFRTTLNTWHLSREFGSSPSLNSTFVQCVPSTRIFADTANDNLYVCANHSIQARRLVSREGRSMTF